MKTFTPTKEQLIELGFEVKEVHYKNETTMTAIYDGNPQGSGGESYQIFSGTDGTLLFGHRNKLYPQSLEDLKTLIRLLTPN